MPIESARKCARAVFADRTVSKPITAPKAALGAKSELSKSGARSGVACGGKNAAALGLN
jgi:hypothetical protein